MSRRRGRSPGLGYLALIVVLVIILLMITRRLQLQIIPTLNMPELGTPQALLQTPEALLQTPQVLPIPTLPSVIVLPPDAPLPAGPQAAPPRRRAGRSARDAPKATAPAASLLQGLST